MKTINYSGSCINVGELKGDIIDISSEGMGIRTDYPLETGRVLRFKKGIGHEAGIVKWIMMVSETSSRDEDNNCRVGVKFV